jgi:hypothetical protein
VRFLPLGGGVGAVRSLKKFTQTARLDTGKVYLDDLECSWHLGTLPIPSGIRIMIVIPEDARSHEIKKHDHASTRIDELIQFTTH